MTTLSNQDLIGKEFELNNLICTIKSIDNKMITYSYRNKGGHIFPNDSQVNIGFLPKIISQLTDKK